jgi:hypothetical protein
MKNKRSQYLYVVAIIISIVVLFGCTPTPPSISTPRPISILLDDFSPQSYQGEAVYFFNRLEGDRGAINNSIMGWGSGQVTTTVSSGNSWAGVWMSLNHPIREGLPVNFSALLPPQIVPAYQSQITGMTVRITHGTPNRTFRVELKDGGKLRWKQEITLDGGQQIVNFDIPALGTISQFVWVLDHASAGDHVVLDTVSFTATTQITDTATAAFVWSYGMLLNNWNPTTGLVRDKAKDASREFDALQATGSLAAATAVAAQLGVIERPDAIQVVNNISHTLLVDTPRLHGLWPHFVRTSSTGAITIAQDTEWSSVDTVIAAIGLLDAQSALGLATSSTEQMLRAIDWDNLITPNGIAHGYTFTGDLIPSAWDVFGGESWLVELAYAGTTGRVAPIAYPSPPTANGSGFIDELAWVFVSPPSGQDYWGTDWNSYRSTAVDNQIAYYPVHNSTSCLAQLGLFGLSAGEVPAPSMVAQNSMYQAYGIGGAFAPANDGSALGAPVVAPHYSAMIASLHPQEAIKMWDWLIKDGYFSPLNNVESLEFPAGASCDSAAIEWNQLKGSWNLSLQTLGWGRYLAEHRGQVPVLWQATTANPLLRKGYLVLVPSELSLTPTLTPQAGIVSAGYNVSSRKRRFTMSHTSTLQKISLLVLLILLSISQAGSVSAHLTSTVAFNWNTSGEKVITVTTKNAGGTSRETHVIAIGAQYHIYLPLVLRQSTSELAVDVAQGVALGVPRDRHTATRLSDGRILLVGGQPALDESLAAVDRFDPATGLITPVAPLHTARHDHSATVLLDGRVLVVGGYTLPQQWLGDAEVYDPSADTWTVVPPLYAHGTAHTATLLNDGRVLVVGGSIGDGVATERVEIFNPHTNAWTAVTPLESDRVDHTAVLLDDGRVLVAGGAQADGTAPAGGDALLYDPQTNRWIATGSMVKPRYLAQSVRLADGRVLAAGGMTLKDKPLQTISTSAEIYDPASNTWTAAADLAQARYASVLALLPTGQVLAVGGARDYDTRWIAGSFVGEIEVYDPLANHWHTAGALPRPGANAAVARLPDGRLWVTGGKPASPVQHSGQIPG